MDVNVEVLGRLIAVGVVGEKDALGLTAERAHEIARRVAIAYAAERRFADPKLAELSADEEAAEEATWD